MHHIAYKLMRKPPNSSRRKAPRSNEVSRSVSPAASEHQDREDITRLKIENETLKQNQEIRENEIECLRDEIQRLKESLNSAAENSDNPDCSFSEGEDAEITEKQKSSVHNEPFCHRHPREEVAIVQQALGSLRLCFEATDPHQHTIDTVEQTLTSLAERLVEASGHAQVPNGSELVRRNSFVLDSYSDIHGSYISSSLGLPVSSVDMNQSFLNKPSTKLVYYTSKSSTPFVSVIHKRLGEITLKDLKSCLDRPGQFRYHFKTLDPEYGMVKEEVVHDEDIIPGWDDRIVAWIEKVDD